MQLISVLDSYQLFLYRVLYLYMRAFSIYYFNQIYIVKKNQVTDDGEAISENIDNSRRNPRPRYRRRLIRRPRTTSSQQTNRLENLPSSGSNRKSPNPTSFSVTSLRSVIDIPPESYNSTKVLLVLLFLSRQYNSRQHIFNFFTDSL